MSLSHIPVLCKTQLFFWACKPQLFVWNRQRLPYCCGHAEDRERGRVKRGESKKLVASGIRMTHWDRKDRTRENWQWKQRWLTLTKKIWVEGCSRSYWIQTNRKWWWNTANTIPSPCMQQWLGNETETERTDQSLGWKGGKKIREIRQKVIWTTEKVVAPSSRK